MITASVVAYHHSYSEIGKVLDCLLKSPVAKIYVVDNSSNDALRLLERISGRIRYIHSANIGYGGAHNIAMREAVEDHRASSGHAPRSIYGRIVAEADRCIDTQTILRRTVQYGLAHCPALTREEHFARCREHLQRKYAEGGYLRLWLPESDNARRLAELREAIRDGERLRRLFDAIFDAETSGPAGGTPDRTEAGKAAEAR